MPAKLLPAGTPRHPRNVHRLNGNATTRADRLRAATRYGVEPLEQRIILSVAPAALYLGTDPFTQGNWRSSYGIDGYEIANDATALPSYASVQVNGAATYTWASPVSDVRALQTAENPAVRMASTFYGGTFSIDVNLTDGQTHQVAFYLLDWDNAGRSETITVTDPATGNTLDTESLSKFENGKYAVYNLTGHVSVQFALAAGANTVVGGLFFGGSAGAANHAPVLGNTSAVFPAINEDDVNNPGTSMADFISALNISDPDPGALQGIAVTGADNSNGNWQYSTNYGDVWNNFGSPTPTQALLLSNTARDRIRFVPGTHFNGTATFTYEAWDHTISLEGGLADASIGGGSSAFSTAAGTATLTINPVPVPPAFPGMNSLQATLNQPISVVLPAATDYNGRPITYSISNLPAGASFDPTTRTFTWTPTSVPGGQTFPAGPVTPLDVSGWNYDAVTENSTTPYAQEFDGPNNSYVSWFQAGLDGHSDGLPPAGIPFASQVTNSVTGGNTLFQFQPFNQNDVLILKDFSANTRALIFNHPVKLSSIAILDASNRVEPFLAASVGFTRIVYYNDGDTGATTSTDGHFPIPPNGIGDPDRADAAPYNAADWDINYDYGGVSEPASPALGPFGYNANIGPDGMGFQYANNYPVGMYETDISLVNGFKVNGAVTDISDKYVQEIFFRKADSAPGGDTGIFALSGSINQNTPPGAVDLQFTASDGITSSTKAVRVYVNNGVATYGIAPVPPQTDYPGSPVSFTLAATGTPPGDAVWSASGLPAGATFNPTTQIFSWTPTAAQAPGTYNPVFTLSDATESVSQSVAMNVKQIPQPPTLTAIPNQSVNELSSLAFTVSATDPSDPGATLTYSAQSLPQGATLNPITGAFAWTPAEGQAAVYNVVFSASDGPSTSSQTVTITVNHTPLAPVLSPIPNQVTSANSPLSFTVSATDGDVPAETITYSAQNLPPGATLNPNTGVFSWTPTAAQIATYQTTFIATDSGSPPLSASQLVTIIVGQAAATSASFVTTDTTTQGNWKTTYGGDGEGIVGDGLSFPAYANVAFNNTLTYTWAASTTDPRALLRAGSTQRIASTWYGGSFSVDVNLVDGQSHRVALYLLDWDGQGRSEQVQVINPATSAVLDTRNVSSFTGGEYLVYNVTGHVQFVLSLVGGANTVLGGLFFGGGGQSVANQAPTLGANAVTLPAIPQGNTNSGGVDLATLTGQLNISDTDGDPAGIAITAADSSNGQWQYSTDGGTTWNALGAVSTTAARLLNNASITRVRFVPNATFNGAATFTLRAWDQSTGANGGLADTTTVGGTSPFSTATATATINVLPAQGGTNAAQFLGSDTTTQGNWQHVYGTDGYNVVANAASYPSYAQVQINGASQWTWNANATDPRSLQDAGSGGGRIAATLYSATSFDIDLNFTDGQAHRVSAYLLDYDTQRRSERVDVIDATTGQVLDSESASNFANGEYLSWNIKGSVILRVTDVSGVNAVLSGLFFG
jgi:hypothetical protein